MQKVLDGSKEVKRVSLLLTRTEITNLFSLKENREKSLGNDLPMLFWDGGQINLTVENN